ncbi:hypothetical protein SNEBB_006587 [Seison nebaliae]|nr:hypothetical protein SNEBB_006587 [Seison nebaliae]
MSVIHYKFKSDKDFTHKITFDGTTLNVGEIKRIILEENGINSRIFNVEILGEKESAFKSDTSVVPRNDRIIVIRLPAGGSTTSLKPIKSSIPNKRRTNEKESIVNSLSQPNKSSTTSNNGQLATVKLEQMSIAPEKMEETRNHVEVKKEKMESETIHVESSMKTSEIEFTNTEPLNKGEEISKDILEKLKKDENLKKEVEMAENLSKEVGMIYGTFQSKSIPSSYICKRCNQRGHPVEMCPTHLDANFQINKCRMANGIPSGFLEPTDATDPKAMRAPDGSFVRLKKDAEMERRKPKLEQHPLNDQLVNSAIAMRSKKEDDGNVNNNNEKEMDEDSVMREKEEQIPVELQCYFCSALCEDAVGLPCCDEIQFCSPCINEHIIMDPTCPKCNMSITQDSIMNYTYVRKQVRKYKEMKKNRLHRKREEEILEDEKAVSNTGSIVTNLLTRLNEDDENNMISSPSNSINSSVESIEKNIKEEPEYRRCTSPSTIPTTTSAVPSSLIFNELISTIADPLCSPQTTSTSVTTAKETDNTSNQIKPSTMTTTTTNDDLNVENVVRSNGSMEVDNDGCSKNIRRNSNVIDNLVEIDTSKPPPSMSIPGSLPQPNNFHLIQPTFPIGPNAMMLAHQHALNPMMMMPSIPQQGDLTAQTLFLQQQQHQLQHGGCPNPFQHPPMINDHIGSETLTSQQNQFNDFKLPLIGSNAPLSRKQFEELKEQQNRRRHHRDSEDSESRKHRSHHKKSKSHKHERHHHRSHRRKDHRKNSRHRHRSGEGSDDTELQTDSIRHHEVDLVEKKEARRQRKKRNSEVSPSINGTKRRRSDDDEEHEKKIIEKLLPHSSSHGSSKEKMGTNNNVSDAENCESNEGEEHESVYNHYYEFYLQQYKKDSVAKEKAKTKTKSYFSKINRKKIN